MLVCLVERATSLTLALELILHELLLLLIHNVLVHNILSNISLNITVAAIAQTPHVVVILLQLLLQLLFLQELLLILP